eukprot:jgi/Hompol1/1500/HPOL_003207-RA
MVQVEQTEQARAADQTSPSGQATASTSNGAGTNAATDAVAAANAEAEAARPPWRPFAEHAAFFAELSVMARYVIAFRILMMLGQIALGVYALYSIYATRTSLQSISLASLVSICGPLLTMLYVLLVRPRYFQLPAGSYDTPEAVERENQRRRVLNSIDLPFIAFFFCGIVALGVSSETITSQPLIFATVLTYVVLSAMYFGSSIILLGLLILFMPCIYIVVRRMQAHRSNIFDGRMGATDEIIAAIPIVTFRRKVAPEQPTSDTVAVIPSTSTSSPPPDASALLANEEAGVPSPIPTAAPKTQAKPPQKKRRRFQLLPKLFRRTKSTDPETPPPPTTTEA